MRERDARRREQSERERESPTDSTLSMGPDSGLDLVPLIVTRAKNQEVDA